MAVEVAIKSLGNVTYDNAAGGYLIPEVMATEILKPIFSENADIIYNLPKTNIIKSQSFNIPAQNSIPVGTREGECKPANLSKATFSNRRLVAKRLGVTIEQSWEFMNFNNLYTYQSLITDISESFIGTLAYEILQGNGTIEYLGILTDTRIQTLFSTNPNAINLDDILNLIGSLKMGQNPLFIMHRSVWSEVQKIKDAEGRPIVNPQVANSTDKRLYGYPVMVVGNAFVADTTNPDVMNGKTYFNGISKSLMPTADLTSGKIVSNSKAIIFGDFKRGYRQNIAESLFIRPDPYTGGAENCMKYYANTYNDGMPVLTDAFAVLQVK